MIVSMGPVSRFVVFGTVVALSSVACAGDVNGPAAPSASFSPALSASPSGTNALTLVEQPGSTPAGGAGIVNVTQTREPGANNFEITVNVHGGPPDADLYFQLRGDVGLGAQEADGVCDRAMVPGFPPPGAGFVLHTSRGGGGATHVKVETTNPGFDPGVSSDFMYRVVGADGFELRTACVQFTGK